MRVVGDLPPALKSKCQTTGKDRRVFPHKLVQFNKACESRRRGELRTHLVSSYVLCATGWVATSMQTFCGVEVLVFGM